MVKKWLFGGVFGLALITSLLSGTVASGAQTPPSLTETYTWEPYGLSVSYPGDWTVAQKSKAISIHPADQDVTDGLGPELILFLIADPHPAGAGGSLSAALGQIVQNFAQDSNGEVSASIPGMIDRYLIQSAALTWTSQDAAGVLRVIGIDLDTVLGIAYIVRNSESARYLPTLRQVYDSMTFETPRSEATAGQSSSLSVVSIQLPQRHVWQDAGLVLYFPAGWEVSIEASAFEIDSITATPPLSAPSAQDSYLIQATGLTWSNQIDLHHIAEIIASGYGGAVTEIADVTVAGYPGVVYDMLDQSETPGYHFRALLVNVSDHDVVVPIVLGSEDRVWDDFRPIASAFIASIERADSGISLAPAGVLRTLVADTPSGTAEVRRQDGGTQAYVWEEYGVTFTLPSAWQTIQAGQDFDLALVSPEAYASGTGTFIMLQTVSSLGPGETIQSALAPVADQVKGEIKPFTTGGVEGATVDFTDDSQGTLHHLVLLPYGTTGEALYIQTLAVSAEDDTTILDILNSMVINPPDADHAQVDAAWQSSLAAEGTLVYGSPDAPIHMIEFLDFSCSHCANYSFDMEHLIPLEADAGRVSIEYVLLDTIGGELSTQAAQATYCATEQGKGYSAYKALFQGYVDEGRDVAYTPDGIVQLLGADDVGVDVEALKTCMDAGRYMDVITQSRTRAADVGVTGTPSLLLGKDGDAPAFLTLPSGDQWSGEIPIHILRVIFKGAIEDGLSLQDAATAFFNQ